MAELGGLEDAGMRVLPQGAFCFVMMDERSVYAARDAYGVRPLSIGRLPNGFVVSSETCALDIVGASFLRDVEPGELIRIDDKGLHSVRFAESPRRACASSSQSTWRGPTPGSTAPRCTSPAARWAGCSRRSTRSRPTW